MEREYSNFIMYIAQASCFNTLDHHLTCETQVLLNVGDCQGLPTVSWVLVDVNLMAIFAPGTNYLKIKKSLTFALVLKYLHFFLYSLFEATNPRRRNIGNQIDDTKTMVNEMIFKRDKGRK